MCEDYDLLLFQDEYWQSLVQYCLDNGGYTGCSIPGYNEGVHEECRDFEEKDHTGDGPAPNKEQKKGLNDIHKLDQPG